MSDVHIVDEISFENYAVFAAELKVAARVSGGVTIHLSSEGGSALASLAYAAAIRLCPRDITIVANGTVQSAAVLILAAGDRRVMTAESWAYVHEENGEITGSVSQLEVEVQQMRALEEQCYALLEKYTRTPAERWRDWHKKTAYFSAEEAKNIGLVDEVI